jgi:hypothetical protein
MHVHRQESSTTYPVPHDPMKFWIFSSGIYAIRLITITKSAMSDLQLDFLTFPSYEVTSKSDDIRYKYMIRRPIFEEDNSHSDSCKCGECKAQGCDRFYCSLCGSRDMTLHAAKRHSREDAHNRNLQELKAAQDDAVGIMVRWHKVHEMPECKRLKEADHKSLPDNILAAVYRYAASRTIEGRGAHLDEVVCNLQAFEHAERLTLLWLAVWKAECLQQIPVISDLFTAQKWFASEWKQQKSNQRQSHAMSTIVSLVCPFVQCPERKSHGKRKSDVIT